MTETFEDAFRQDWPVCTACGTQFDSPATSSMSGHCATHEMGRTRCPICDDPRQAVPASGQQFTTLQELRKQHRNKIVQDPVDPKVSSIYTEPHFGIGQRAVLIETEHGNVLWDCIALLDRETFKAIQSKGGIKAMVISHPHFYTTNGVWSRAFQCPVYIASDDIAWLFSRPDDPSLLRLVESPFQVVVPHVTMIKAGGHFPGSMCLHYKRSLFASDTVMMKPSAKNPEKHRTDATLSFAFMWSILNSIPLDPATIYQILTRLKPFEFDTFYGNIPGLDLRHSDVKKRVAESARIQVAYMGWADKPEGQLVMDEVW